jgi:hypothetical protein
MKKKDVKNKWTKLTMIELKNPIKMSKVGEKDESSNSIGHEYYHPILIGRWNLFSVSLGTRIFMLNFIRRSNHFRFPLFMKDEKAID